MTHPLEATLEDRDGRWVLTFTREFRCPVADMWPWLTDPDHLGRWSPVVPDRRLDSVGSALIRENPGDEPVDGTVVAVDPPHELIHNWGPDVLRWRLTPTATGCRLTLEQQMAARTHAAENAGGWHICLDVLEGNLNGDNPHRLVGDVVMAHGFIELRDGYRKVLGT
jgi:uncharacterized protein YndB with AHSA1/START domain